MLIELTERRKGAVDDTKYIINPQRAMFMEFTLHDKPERVMGFNLMSGHNLTMVMESPEVVRDMLRQACGLVTSADAAQRGEG